MFINSWDHGCVFDVLNAGAQRRGPLPVLSKALQEDRIKSLDFILGGNKEPLHVFNRIMLCCRYVSERPHCLLFRE